ncbi:hypothetical protein N7468_001531 [Penicillium chermesinum]|uniref:Uncharacterized protein n=1 Tax=Penicillium chermesinum TaxID=63820 RepID=A0A9W9TXF8_9EURO|nr:uncharacterized protein N7468_001531 [Penicillium chermesinum]KAJ5246548.1 hypothetical protein N7468_001531 [Penicillium chermesinum]
MFSSNKFFDSIAFWKEKHEKSEEEKEQLQNTVFMLEQRIKSLQSENPAEKEPAAGEPAEKEAAPASKRSKRKAPVNASQSKQRKRKRGRPSKDESPGEEKFMDPLLFTLNYDQAQRIAYENDPDSLNKGGKKPYKDVCSQAADWINPGLMRQLYRLKCFILPKKCAQQEVTTEAVILCKLAEREIFIALSAKLTQEISFETPEDKYVAQGPSMREIEPTIDAIALAFAHVLQALAKVAEDRDDATSKGRIIYHLVCLFESTMKAVSLGCMAPYKHMQTARKIRLLLARMFTYLDTARVEDREVLEGCLQLLLSRLGKLVALKTFQVPGLAHFPALSSDRSRFMMDGMGELGPEPASREGEYLVDVLKVALCSQPGYLPMRESSNKKSDFFHANKTRMQKTLLQAIFGSEDPFLQGGLAPPATPPPSDDRRDRRSTCFDELFLEELWDLLGWDVLTRQCGKHGTASE